MCLGKENISKVKKQNMNKTVISDKYLVNYKNIAKSSTKFTSVDQIEEYLKGEIKTHQIATYISTFDHFAHTKSIGGMIPDDILASINVLCCFGMAIPGAEFMAVKPMSIAVVEKPDSFVLSFIDAPAPSVQQAMERWVDGLVLI